MHVIILGRRFEFKFVPFLGIGVHGKCENPKGAYPVIRIKKGLSDKEELDAVVHEAFHGGNWRIDEEWVDEFATDLATILYRLGYRKQKDNVDKDPTG